jgi:CheY-like chemotaxis protein
MPGTAEAAPSAKAALADYTSGFSSDDCHVPADGPLASWTRMPNNRPIRILFVEDDRHTRDGYAAYLTDRGYDVVPAATGAGALKLAALLAPDVVVLDMALPDIDGWEVARQLKAGERTKTVPIIALTGADLPHERASAMRAGCDRHLAKPCDPAVLLDAIQRSSGA